MPGLFIKYLRTRIPHFLPLKNFVTSGLNLPGCWDCVTGKLGILKLPFWIISVIQTYTLKLQEFYTGVK